MEIESHFPKILNKLSDEQSIIDMQIEIEKKPPSPSAIVG